MVIMPQRSQFSIHTSRERVKIAGPGGAYTPSVW